MWFKKWFEKGLEENRLFFQDKLVELKPFICEFMDFKEDLLDVPTLKSIETHKEAMENGQFDAHMPFKDFSNLPTEIVIYPNVVSYCEYLSEVFARVIGKIDDLESIQIPMLELASNFIKHVYVHPQRWKTIVIKHDNYSNLSYLLRAYMLTFIVAHEFGHVAHAYFRNFLNKEPELFDIAQGYMRESNLKSPNAREWAEEFSCDLLGFLSTTSHFHKYENLYYYKLKVSKPPLNYFAYVLNRETALNDLLSLDQTNPDLRIDDKVFMLAVIKSVFLGFSFLYTQLSGEYGDEESSHPSPLQRIDFIRWFLYQRGFSTAVIDGANALDFLYQSINSGSKHPNLVHPALLSSNKDCL